MLVWLNGTFGVGKTTTATRIRAVSPAWRVFDPEWVGYMLRANLSDLDLADFQDLAPWRRLVPRVAHEIVELTGDDLLAVQTVLVEDYWAELRSGLDEHGLRVVHVVLDADELVLRQRIADDTVESGARQWRLDHLDQYRSARPWMLAAADLVVDVTERSPDEAAAAVLEGVSRATAR